MTDKEMRSGDRKCLFRGLEPWEGCSQDTKLDTLISYACFLPWAPAALQKSKACVSKATNRREASQPPDSLLRARSQSAEYAGLN